MLRRTFGRLNAELVKCAQNGAVVTLTLNRPEALNALNPALVSALATKILAYDTDPSVNVMILTGEGRAFVAGADIKAMASMTFNDWYQRDFFRDIERLREVRKPLIAAVNGFALGGGCELAMACDIIVASNKAVFGQPEIKLGTIPGFGGTQRLASLIGTTKAMEWILTGKQYTAAEAEHAGLVTRVVPHDELMPTVNEMAKTIAGYSRLTTALAKDCVNKVRELSLTEGLAFEKRTFHATFSSYDQKEGMKAFMEKRAPVFKNE